MRPSSRAMHKPSAGFSLVELMVGMVIGMFGIIVMLQVFALSEERKRTTTGGSDAMTEGVMALYALQRDIRQAGYGVSALDILSCPVTVSGVTIALAPVTINPAAAIVPAGDANTDTLLVIYGNSEGQPQGVAYVANTVNPTPANRYVVIDSPCTAAPISSGATSRAVAGTFYDLGLAPKVLAYAVRSGNLTMCDYIAQDCSDAANYATVANNIVSLRAQYGHDNVTTPNPLPAGSMAGVPDPLTGKIPAYRVDTYDQTQAQDLPVGATAACKWARTGAVRLALVARSALFEKDAVTAAAPVWEGSDGAPIDLSGNADWANFRYKVFQTVVPLRNVTWMGVQEGC
ncbi:MAG: hypothetical protein H6R17_3345 [Proteobacteria bacterium]|nr:hypothetical protein [Pseudomonadota bacterium]